MIISLGRKGCKNLGRVDVSDKESNVLWPERFRVPEMDDDEAEELAREVAEWDAYLPTSRILSGC
jgi:hypothetical protein